MTQPADVTSRLDWHDLTTAMQDTVDAVTDLRQTIGRRNHQEEPVTHADDPDAALHADEILDEERRRREQETERTDEATGSDLTDPSEPELE